MPATKKKEKHNLKRQGDPIGNRYKGIRVLNRIFCDFNLFLDDILKTNLYLAKYARPASDNHPLSKLQQQQHELNVKLNFFVSVEEIRYERILPKLNGANVAASTEFKFTIPPSSDYFTRCVCVCVWLKTLFLF